MLKTKIRFWTVGSIVLLAVLLLYSPLSAEKGKLKIRPGKLIALDYGDEFSQNFEPELYAAGKKGNIIAFSVLAGYEDKNGKKYLPYFKASLKKAAKALFRVDFTCTKSAKLGIWLLFMGPVGTMVSEEDFEIDVKKNVYYQQEFELGEPEERDLQEEGVPGIYDVIAIIYPTDEEMPMVGSGGMTIATCRLQITK